MSILRCLRPSRILRHLPVVMLLLLIFVMTKWSVPHITIEIKIQDSDYADEDNAPSLVKLEGREENIVPTPPTAKVLARPDLAGNSENHPGVDGLPAVDGPAASREDTDKLIPGQGKKSTLPEKHNRTCSLGKDSPEYYKCSLPADLYTPGLNFDRMLKETADEDRHIFLASVDSGYINMALNFYETSLLKHKIKNYLFVCSDLSSKAELEAYNVSCYYYGQDGIGKTEKASRYMSKDFILKTHIKTKIILGALTLNYTVIITDVDIVFLRNPLEFMNCLECDVEIQSDHMEENSGFYLVRPTSRAIELHNLALRLGTSKTSNQKALKGALNIMRKAGKIKTKILSKTDFPCGLYYFEQKKRLFAGDSPCTSCVIVHNNWIAGKLAKIYRFKEHLMWTVDPHGYYSSATAKYLLYDNYLDFGDRTKDVEISGLKDALFIGNILKRIVILPDFTCSKCGQSICKGRKRGCPLNVHLKVSSLDINLPGSYREHMFLNNSKVPQSIKQSISKPLLIISALSGLINKTDVVVFTPGNSISATPEEISTWFSVEPYRSTSVLRFDSLYKVFDNPINSKKYKDFQGKLKKAITKGSYRQF